MELTLAVITGTLVGLLVSMMYIGRHLRAVVEELKEHNAREAARDAEHFAKEKPPAQPSP